MARQSADKVANARWPQGRQVMWDAMRRCTDGLDTVGSTFSVSRIWEACGREIPKATIRTYIDGLTRAGILKRVSEGSPTTPAFYRIAGRQGAGTEAMWRTIKMLATFSAAELALTASTDIAPVTEETAKTYLRYLERAGFVRCVVKGKPGRGGNKDRWNFVKSRDPGPLPPQIQRIKQVFDPNSNSVVWPKESRS